MCGRYTLRTSAKQLALLFDVSVPQLNPQYNIAPSQQVAAIRFNPQQMQREFAFFQWNFVPFWSAQPKTKYSMINARAETVAEKRSFRDAFQRRRCLILADGFTEANELLQPLHDRMPVILEPDDYDLWLDPELGEKERLEQLRRPYSSQSMEAYPVSTLVNKPSNDVKACLEPLGH